MNRINSLTKASRLVVAAYIESGLKICTAESCTGGMIAAGLTSIPGSSAVLERGFVVYSNEAKSEMLGVPPALIQQFGAVSEQTARAMAEGALQNSRADIAAAVTGIAGPGGGGLEKPVGLVFTALAARGMETICIRRIHPGGRDAVRRATSLEAMDLLMEHSSRKL
jgi:nicotinamide-nucleotide amidase